MFGEVSYVQIDAAAHSLAATAGVSMAGFNRNPAGRWDAFATAAETLAGTEPADTNVSIAGHMYRAAVALETLSGTDGEDETRTEIGLLKRIVDALEVFATPSPSLDYSSRLVLAADGASFTLGPLMLSAATIAENAAAGTVVGTILGATTGSTITLHDSDGNRFALDGNAVEVGATNTDFEAGASRSITLRETRAGMSNSPRDTVLTITVTNVLEVTLAALGGTFSLAEDAAAAAVAGALTGVSSGSTLSLVDDAGGRVALSGTNIVRGATALDYETATSHGFTVRETHPDGSNSPRDTVLSLTVTDVLEEQAETTALVSAMSVAPDSTRRGHIDTLIAALKSAGVWSKLDQFFIFAGADAQAALLNWITPSVSASNNLLSFTADRGFGSASTGRIDLVTAPSALANLTPTSFLFGVYQRVNNTASQCDMGALNSGSEKFWLRVPAFAAPRCNANSDTLKTGSGGDPHGMSTAARSGNDSYYRHNGSVVGTFTEVNSPAESANPFYVSGYNAGGFVSESYSAGQREYSAAFVGGFLTAGEDAALYSAVQTYMTAVGAQV